MLLQGPIAPALFRLAIPIILGNALQSGYQLTDAFWVGRLGAPAVAAVAVSFPVTFLVIALGAGLAMAGAVLSAQYMGAGRQDMVNHVAAQTMVMVAASSIILGTAGYVSTYWNYWASPLMSIRARSALCAFRSSASSSFFSMPCSRR